MSERKTSMRAVAIRYQRADRASKRRILDELCATNGWHRDHARKTLRDARRLTVVPSARLRTVKYGPEVVAALVFCWSVLGMPTGKRLAPVLGELVPILRRFGELNVDDHIARLLVGMSAATIDRRLAPEREKHERRVRGYAGCARYAGPRSVLKSQTPPRIPQGWEDAVPGFVEAGVLLHEGGVAGQHAWTLTITDIATGWTEKRSLCNETSECMPAMLDDIAGNLPFPILGVVDNNGSELINGDLLAWSVSRRITHTPPGPPGRNVRCYAGQTSRAGGRHRCDCAAEVLRLNKIWKLQSVLTNFFYAHQRLVSKVPTGTGVSRRYDTATTPHRRAEAHGTVSAEDKAILADTYATINPAAVQRQIQELTAELAGPPRPLGQQGRGSQVALAGGFVDIFTRELLRPAACAGSPDRDESDGEWRRRCVANTG